MTSENLAAITKIDWCGIGRQSDDNDRATNKKINSELASSFEQFKTTDNNYVVPGCLIISTFKNGNAPTSSPKLIEGNGRTILLTLKQATILGLFILRKFTTLASMNGSDILTPLSGAIFSRNNLPKMLEESEIEDPRPTVEERKQTGPTRFQLAARNSISKADGRNTVNHDR